MTTKPLFTTVISVHNRADMVREALSSVLLQQSGDQQVIVVDDGSTDDTPGVLGHHRIVSHYEQGDPGTVEAPKQGQNGFTAAAFEGRFLASGV